MSFEQIEINSNDSTHTIYETCGFSNCREKILEALGVGDERFSDAGEFHVTSDGREFSNGPIVKVSITLTVRSLDEQDSCTWCFGCGDFLEHGLGCDCEERGHDPEKDREPLEPMVEVNGELQLRPFR